MLINKNVFVITKNSDWEFLTKNLVTSKRYESLGWKTLKFLEFTENLFLGEKVREKSIYRVGGGVT